MPLKDHLKIGILALCLPAIIVVVVHLATPDPKASKESFPVSEFLPARVGVIQKKERKGKDYFELWVHAPDGRSFFFRSPESEPVTSVRKSIHDGNKLQVRYMTTSEGNVLVELLDSQDKKPLISFENVMAEYAGRRRLVHIIAGVWSALGAGLWFVLARTDVVTPKPVSEK